MTSKRIGRRVVANRDIDGFFEIGAARGTVGTIRRTWWPRWVEVEFDNGYLTELPTNWISKAAADEEPDDAPAPPAPDEIESGAGDGNRTRTVSLGS